MAPTSSASAKKPDAPITLHLKLFAHFPFLARRSKSSNTMARRSMS
jgi:hypothetical protein